LRPAFAHDAVKALPDGRVRVVFKAPWRSGVAHADMTADKFLARLRRKRSLRGRMVCVVTRMACAATSGTAQTVKKSAFHAHPARMPRDFRTRPADQILGLNLLSASPEVQPIAAREVRHLPAHVDAGYAANDRRGAGRGAVSGHGGGGGSVLFARAGNGQSRGIGGRS
jgi:hypothetical protein